MTNDPKYVLSLSDGSERMETRKRKREDKDASLIKPIFLRFFIFEFKLISCSCIQ